MFNRSALWGPIHRVFRAGGVATLLGVLLTLGLSAALTVSQQKIVLSQGEQPVANAPTWQAGQYWDTQQTYKLGDDSQVTTSRTIVLGTRNVLGTEAYVLSLLPYGADGTPTQPDVTLISTSGFVLFEPAVDQTPSSQAVIAVEKQVWNFPLTVGKSFPTGYIDENKLLTAVVEGVTPVDTPAGRFDTFQIRRGGDEDTRSWYAPAAGAEVKFETLDGRIQWVLEAMGSMAPEAALAFVYSYMEQQVSSEDSNLRYSTIDPLEKLARYDIARDRAIALLGTLSGDSDELISQKASQALQRLLGGAK